MKVLEAIERLGQPTSLSGVAGQAQLSPSTTHRYLVSLTRVGLVKQDTKTGYYDFGPAARRLGIEAIRRTDDINLATTYAAALRDATGHTVNLSVWADGGPTIVRWEHGRYPLPIMARVGSVLPVVDSSVGRVYLAFLPSALTDNVVKAQQLHGESSTPTRGELDAISNEVRTAGLSKTVNGVLPGVVALAAPAFGAGGVVSVVFASTVLARLAGADVLAKVEAQLTNTAAALSRDLGGPTAAEVAASWRP